MSATLSPKSKRPDRPADERGRGTTCWFGAGRTAVIPQRFSDTLCARYRAQPASLADDVRATVPGPALSLLPDFSDQAGAALLLPVAGISIKITILHMCFDEDSHPPIRPIAGAAVDGKRITLHSADGTDFAAYAAQPAEPSGAAMIVLPDVRGLFTFYEELALRFAESGMAAMVIDYFGRTAGTDPRPAGFDHSPHISKVTWPGLRADIGAARREIETWAGVRGAFSVGFCFGGRLSLLLASEPELAMAGVVGFYGWPVGESRGGVPAPIDRVSANSAPVLAIFGGADEGLPASVVDTYRSAMADAGAPHEVITYPGAPHSFFDRKADDYAADSADAWQRVLDFVKANTPQA